MSIAGEAAELVVDRAVSRLAVSVPSYARGDWDDESDDGERLIGRAEQAILRIQSDIAHLRECRAFKASQS